MNSSDGSQHDISLPVDVIRIQSLLPHRYPFLLVDRVIELEPNKRIRAIKNVTINEPFFQGHFPGQLSVARKPDDTEQLFYLVKIDNARFSRMVVPGDQLDMEVVLKRTIRNMAQYDCVARVDGKEAASAMILCAESRS